MSDTQLEMQTGATPDLGNMTAAQAARFGVDLCSALLENESERGFHGALHPMNLTYADEKVQLGEPLELDGDYSPDELEYLPPELFWNGVGGPATDVYAVGLLLYTACSAGRPAFAGDCGELTGEVRAAAATRRLKGEALRAPRDAGEEFAQVILRAVAYKEEERWPDVESLRNALEDCCEFAPLTEAPKRSTDAIAAAAGAAAVRAIDKAAEKAQAEAVPAVEAPAEGKSENKPARKKKNELEVPEGHPRPVYDVFNEKKKAKKRSPLPVIATILALLVIFCAVLYLFKGGDEPVEPTPTPPVTTPDTPADPTPTPETPPVDEPDVGPEVEPTPEVTPEPTPDTGISVALTQLGSASWNEAAAMCANEGGHLPVVHDREELAQLIEAAEAAGVSYVWLDAKRGTDGVWRTSAGEEISYLPWFTGEPSGTDTDGTAENYLMLWKFKGVWGYNDMRADPGTVYARYYGGKIAVFCQED